MKPVTILIVGAVTTLAVFAAESYVATIVFLLSCLTLFLVLAGTLVPVHSRTGRLVLPAADPAISSPQWPCLESQKFDPRQEHRIEFGIETKGFGLLAAIGSAALWFIGLVLAKHGNPLRPYPAVGETGEYLIFFVLVFVLFVPLSMAAGWFFERRLLASSMLAVGGLDPNTGAYTFCDQHGTHYGGTKKPVPPRPQDNICVVFYSPKNPDANRSSAGLMFHRLRLLAASAGGAA